MAEVRCSISLVINGARWLQEGETLAAQVTSRACGRSAACRITFGFRLAGGSVTLEQTAIADQRWCRAKPNSGDGEAVCR